METSNDYVEFLIKAGPMLIAAAALAWNIIVWRWSARKEETKELRSYIDAVSKQLNEHVLDGTQSRQDIASRLTAIEGELRHMPTAEAYQRNEVALAELNGHIAVLSERLKPVSAISDRLQEFLLDEAARGRAK